MKKDKLTAEGPREMFRCKNVMSIEYVYYKVLKTEGCNGRALGTPRL